MAGVLDLLYVALVLVVAVVGLLAVLILTRSDDVRENTTTGLTGLAVVVFVLALAAMLV